MSGGLNLASWYLLAGGVYYFLGIETKGRSIEEINDDLVKPIPVQARKGPLSA